MAAPDGGSAQSADAPPAPRRITPVTGNRFVLVVLAALTLPGCHARSQPFADPPAVRARSGIAELALTAASDAHGRDTWLFNGQAVQPEIRLSPGDVLNIHYVNALPATRLAEEPRGRRAGPEGDH